MHILTAQSAEDGKGASDEDADQADRVLRAGRAWIVRLCPVAVSAAGAIRTGVKAADELGGRSYGGRLPSCDCAIQAVLTLRWPPSGR